MSCLSLFRRLLRLFRPAAPRGVPRVASRLTRGPEPLTPDPLAGTLWATPGVPASAPARVAAPEPPPFAAPDVLPFAGRAGAGARVTASAGPRLSTRDWALHAYAPPREFPRLYDPEKNP